MAVTGSYGGDPAANNRDHVRFLMGDVRAPFLLSDQEVDYLIGRHGGILASAAAGCDNIASQFAVNVDKKLSNIDVKASQRIKHYRETAAQLRRRMVAEGEVEVFVGGLSEDDKRALLRDDDLVQPATQIGQDDYPGADTHYNELLGDCQK